MKSLWQVAYYEYARNVFKKSFVFALLGVPFFIALSVGMGFIIETIKDNSQPVGYVDEAGVFSQAINSPTMRSTWFSDKDESIEFIPYPSENEARKALRAQDIQAYYLVPSFYGDTRQVRLVYINEPGENARKQFYNFLKINLLVDQPPEIAARVARGSQVFVRSLDGLREVFTERPTFGLLLPLFITMAFLFMLILSSGYMMGAVADEKENRTLEVLVTSISPGRLIVGKVLGIVAISLTLLLVWSLVVIIGVFLAVQMGIAWFEDLSVDWRGVVATIVVAIPAYILAVALMTAIGAMVTTTQEGQSVGMIFFFLFAVPLYVSWAFLENPHSPLAVILSLMPFTALVTVGMRNLFTFVPAWQILASFVIQTICALGALWIAGRAFRFGMLRYGQRLTWRRMLGALQR